MTRRQRQLSEQRWGASLLRAPQAGEVVQGGDGGGGGGGFAPPDGPPAFAFDNPESDVRIIRPGGAGQPLDHDEHGSNGGSGGPANGSPSNGFAYAGQNGWEEQPAAPGRAVALPASPQDHEGMHQALLWVAWAVEECSRAYTSVSGRVSDVERRLAALEEAERGREAAAAVGAVVSEPQAGSDRDAWLEDMASKLKSHRAEMLSRTDGLDRRLRELDLVPLKLSNVLRELDKVRSAQLAASKAATAEPPPKPAPAALTPNPEVARLARQLRETQRRLSSLDARTTSEALATVVDGAVQAHTERLAQELSNDKADVEGVYRELDSIAEFVAGRAASTAETLERIGPLEIAVLELRRDVARALSEPVAAQGMRETDRRIRELDARFQKLEESSRRVDRLYDAMRGLLGGEEQGAGSRSGNGSAAGA